MINSMNPLNILTLIGSRRTGSLNRLLFTFLRELAPPTLSFDVVEVDGLPYVDQDQEHNPPEAVKAFKAQVKACDGILFVTPEYNRSIPGVLKNAIDWASRPVGDNSWDGKTAGVIGAAPGGIGTFGAQTELRKILTQLNVAVLPAPQVYFSTLAHIKDGKLSEDSKPFLAQYLTALTAWIQRFQ